MSNRMRGGERNFPPGRGNVVPGVQWIAPGTPFIPPTQVKGTFMNTIVYIVGAIVIIGAILSFFGLR